MYRYLAYGQGSDKLMQDIGVGLRCRLPRSRAEPPGPKPQSPRDRVGACAGTTRYQILRQRQHTRKYHTDTDLLLRRCIDLAPHACAAGTTAVVVNTVPAQHFNDLGQWGRYHYGYHYMHADGAN